MSEKLTEKAIASNPNLRLQREINLHMLPPEAAVPNFTGFAFFEIFFDSIVNEN